MIFTDFQFLEHKICFNKISVPFTCQLSVTIGQKRIWFRGEGHRSIADRRLHMFRIIRLGRDLKNTISLKKRLFTSSKHSLTCHKNIQFHLLIFAWYIVTRESWDWWDQLDYKTIFEYISNSGSNLTFYILLHCI